MPKLPRDWCDDFRRFVSEEQLFGPQDRLLLAVSGGLDSTVLWHTLEQLGYNYTPAHCNFGLRAGESDGDAAFVRSLAAACSREPAMATFNTGARAVERGISLQMAARELRYYWLKELAVRKGYDCILTAHHADDAIETMLLNFLRGTGLRGLTGIPLREGRLRRPLLFTGRDRIAGVAEAAGLQWREDRTNAEDKYRRNHLRHHVLPVLRQLNPGLSATAAANFSHLRQALSLYDAGLQELTRQLRQEDPNGWQADRSAVLRHPAGEALLYEWLTAAGFSAEQVRQARTAAPGTLLRSTAGRLLADGDRWHFRAGQPDDSVHLLAEGEHRLELAGGASLEWECGLPVPDRLAGEEGSCLLDQQLLQFPLQLRRWEKGDRFCPLGMGGNSKKLQDFFTDQKINRLDREDSWVLVNGNREIVWLVGYRLDDRYKVTDHTSRCCRFVFRQVRSGENV